MPTLAPAADVYETDGEFVVELEVPGFDEKELEIEVRDLTLSVTQLEKRLERRFELPAEIDSEHVKTGYTKGVLTIHVPKAAHEEPHKVEIAKA